MNVKSSAIIIVTLLLGMLIGFFIAGRLADRKIKHLEEISRDHRKEGKRLAERLMLTENQLDSLKPIMQDHLKAKHHLMNEHRNEMDSLRNEMFNSIRPKLDKKQLNRLERMQNRAESRAHRPPKHDRPNHF